MEENESCEDLLNEVASKSPAPGGGSVAALSGSFGAALVSMVCNLTIGKKKYRDVEEDMNTVLSEAEILKKELLALSKEDVEAFNEVFKAFQIPDEEEKKESLEKAYKNAANVPLKVGKRCQRVMELAQITTRKGNKNAITDSGVGALMAHSGLKGAVLNVKVNLKEIEDSAFNTKIQDQIEEIEKKGEEIIKSVITGVEDSLSYSL